MEAIPLPDQKKEEIQLQEETKQKPSKEINDDIIKKIVERYQKQRDIMVQLLRSISGVDCHLPDGTFFVFPDVSSYGYNSSEISNFLLDYHNVATVPGNAFGPSGEGFLRLVFKSDINSIKSGITQMKNGLNDFNKKINKV